MFATKKIKEAGVDKIREQEETARVYAEFVKSFDVSADSTKQFLRGGIVSKGSDGLLVNSAVKSTVYKPQKKGLWVPPPSSANSSSIASSTSIVSSFFSVSSSASCTQNAAAKPQVKSKTKEIDSFLEEIKRRQLLQEERKKLSKAVEETQNEEEREKIRLRLASLESVTKVGMLNMPPPPSAVPLLSSGTHSIYENPEPECSTNLYIGNLSPEVTEEYLCQQFGKYGVITSVKIMYPRTEEEKMRKRNCGFVSFQTRQQAEAAKNGLDASDFYGMTVRIGWGKSVAKPTVSPTPPILPIVPGVSMIAAGNSIPAVTGVTPAVQGFSDNPPILPETKRMEVKVPRSTKTKILIDTLAKYVAEEGHPFEQCIMEKESPTGRFRFLFEHNSEDNIYYRWLVYAYAQGDTTAAWRTEGFFIFIGGALWIPPSEEYFLQPRVRVTADSANYSAASAEQNREKMRLMQQGKQKLSSEEQDALRIILNELDFTRDSICSGMTYCLDHAFCAFNIAEFLFNSISNEELNENTNQLLDVKLSRLYLISDILYNSSSLQPSAWSYRNAFEVYLPEIFNYFNSYLRSISKLSGKILKETVLRILRIWEDWAIYAPQFIQGLESTFLKSDKRLKLFINDYDDSEENLMKEKFLDEDLDGIAMEEFDELIKVPIWLRPLLYEWKKAGERKLERICKQRGIIWTDISKRKELILQNLINFELFWNSNALQINLNRCSYLHEPLSEDDDEKVKLKTLNEKEESLTNLLNSSIGLCNVGGTSYPVDISGRRDYDKDEDIFNLKYDETVSMNGDNNMDATNINNKEDIKHNGNEKVDISIHSESSDDIFADDDDDDLKNNNSLSEETNSHEGKENEQSYSLDLHDDHADQKLLSISRNKLRAVELEVMQLQVNLEKTGMDETTIQMTCDIKRQQLIQVYFIIIVCNTYLIIFFFNMIFSEL